jgi:methionine salvage enolase-phosphatase E1
VVFDVEGPLVAPTSQSPKEAAALKMMEMVIGNYVIVDPKSMQEHAIELEDAISAATWSSPEKPKLLLDPYNFNGGFLKRIALQEKVYGRIVSSKDEANKLLKELGYENRDKALLYWQSMIEVNHPLWDIMRTWMLGAIHKGEIKIEAYNGVEHIPSLQNEGFTLETLSGAPIFLQEAMLKNINSKEKMLYDCFANFYSGKKMEQQTYEKVFADKLVEAYIADSIGELHLAKKAGAKKLFLTTTPGMNKETIDDAKSKKYHVVNSIEEIVYKILK